MAPWSSHERVPKNQSADQSTTIGIDDWCTHVVRKLPTPMACSHEYFVGVLCWQLCTVTRNVQLWMGNSGQHDGLPNCQELRNIDNADLDSTRESEPCSRQQREGAA